MLQILLIIFITLAVISVLGVSLLFLFKNTKSKTIVFYLLAVIAMLIAYLNITSLPSNYIFQQLIACSLGLLSVIAIIFKVIAPQKTNVAYLLVSLSAILGLLNLFLF